MTESNQDVVDQGAAPGTSRRAALLGAGALGAAGLLAACGTSPTPTTAPTTGAGTTPPPTATTPGGATSAGVDPNAIKVADIPLGSGAIFADRKVVVTQPTAGTFKAFDTTCTHMGCQVTEVQGNKIKCLCHGSQYNVADGSVAQGPATRPLAAKTATVNGATVTIS